jgi:serine/threonine protein kinase
MELLSKHPNIVFMESSFDLGEFLSVFVLDLCDVTLYKYMKRYGGKLQCEQAQSVMKGMTKGLEVLRQNNIFHRDLKPENIFLTFEEDATLIPKLGDFGLAKRLTRKDELSYSRTGSPMYLAPEIWSGEGYTSKSDIYSCGIVLYEMITGNPPFYRCRNALQLRRLVLYKGITENDVQQLSLDVVGKSLARSLTQRCPKERISWEDFFAHLWFSETNKLES